MAFKLEDVRNRFNMGIQNLGNQARAVGQLVTQPATRNATTDYLSKFLSTAQPVVKAANYQTAANKRLSTQMSSARSQGLDPRELYTAGPMGGLGNLAAYKKLPAPIQRFAENKGAKKSYSLQTPNLVTKVTGDAVLGLARSFLFGDVSGNQKLLETQNRLAQGKKLAPDEVSNVKRLASSNALNLAGSASALKPGMTKDFIGQLGKISKNAPKDILKQNLYYQDMATGEVRKIPDALKSIYWALDNLGDNLKKTWHVTAGLTPEKIKLGGLREAAPITDEFTSSLIGQTGKGVDVVRQSAPANLPRDVKNIIGGAQTKERGFITSLKESPRTPEAVKEIIEGRYVVKSGSQLKKDALDFIRTDPMGAEKIALNPKSDVDIQVGHELLAHYAAVGDSAKFQQLSEGMANSGTEFGRAVQAFANYEKTSPEGAARAAADAVSKYNRTHTTKIKLTNEQIKDIFETATDIQRMPLGRERNIAENELMNKISDLIPSSIVDKAITVWKAGLLTSLRTHERNLLGNTLHAGAEVAKDIPASLADRLMGLRTGKRSTTFTTQGMVEGGKKGVQSAKDMLTKGYDPEEVISKFDVKRITWNKNPVEQTLKKYTDVVFRTLGAEDKPFWNSAYARSLYDQAGAEAINAGKQADAQFLKNLVDNPTTQMKVTATKDANIATFHDENSFRRVASSIKEVLSKHELSKLGGEIIAPFTGVPSSIAGQLINYSPIGLIKGSIKAGNVVVKNIPSLQREAAQELGRGTVGTALFALGAYLLKKGLMTGQPKDQAEARQWELENKPRNSVFVGGKWRSINSVGPEAIIILAGAKAQEELNKGEDASAGSFGANIGKDFLGQTFLSGVQQPLQAINDPARYGESYLRNQIASGVPNIVKDAARATDPFNRDTKSISDQLKYSVPGLRSQLPIRNDVLGTPVPNNQYGAGAFIDVFNSKTPTRNDPVVMELNRLNVVGENATPGNISKNQTIGGVKYTLTPMQVSAFESLAGTMVRQQISTLVNSPGYQRLSDADKKKLIEKAVDAGRTIAKSYVYSGKARLPGTLEKAK